MHNDVPMLSIPQMYYPVRGVQKTVSHQIVSLSNNNCVEKLKEKSVFLSQINWRQRENEEVKGGEKGGTYFTYLELCSANRFLEMK